MLDASGSMPASSYRSGESLAADHGQGGADEHGGPAREGCPQGQVAHCSIGVTEGEVLRGLLGGGVALSVGEELEARAPGLDALAAGVPSDADEREPERQRHAACDDEAPVGAAGIETRGGGGPRRVG
jgi:hypothetical protein